MTLLVAAVAELPVRAQTPATGQGPPATAPASDYRGLWALRAARTEAALRLLEQIEAVGLQSGTSAGQFLAQSPRLSEAMLLYLLSREDAHRPVLAPDGTCRVALSIDPASLEAALEAIAARYAGSGTPIPGDRRPRLGQALEQSAVVEPRSPLVANAPVAYAAGEDYFSRVDAATREYWLANVTQTGRARTEQAALDDALDRLADRAKDIRLPGDVRLADFVARWAAATQPAATQSATASAPQATSPASRPAGADFRQFLRAARQLCLLYYRDAPVIEVDSEVTARTVLACVKAWVQTQKLPQGQTVRLSEDLRGLERQVVAVGDAVIRTTGMAWPRPDELWADPPVLAGAALAAAAPPWVGSTLRAAGRGAPDAAVQTPARARQQAIANAQWDARCQLARRLGNLPVKASVRISDLAARDPAFRAGLLTVLQDAWIVHEPRISREGQAEVALEVSTTGLWRLLFDLQKRALAAGPASRPAR